MNLPWRILPRADSMRILAVVNPLLHDGLLSPTSQVRAATLSFYKYYQFYEIADAKHPQGKVFALHNPGSTDNSTCLLDWSNGPIYTVNDSDPIRLRHENIAEYLSFFFACVQGPYGPMTVVEHLDAPPNATAQTRKSLQEVLQMVPPRVANYDSVTGTFTVYAGMLFKDCVFKTKLEVGSNGLIQIIDHEMALGGVGS